MYSFGVYNCLLSFHLIPDEPQGCLQFASESQKIAMMYDVMASDFGPRNHSVEFGSEDFFCHQVVAMHGDFHEKCCQMTSEKESGILKCKVDLEDFWIEFLNTLIFVLKVLVFLFGPIIFKRYMYTNSMLTMDYQVEMPKPFKLNVHFRKMKRGLISLIDPTRVKPLRGFNELRKDLARKDIKWNTTQTMTCQTANILVDHNRLVNETVVPVGFFKTIYDSFFMCGIRKVGPFKTLCLKSLFGSCDDDCLCFDLKFLRKLKKTILPSWHVYVTWGALGQLIGGFALMLILPLPHYIRMIVYYKFENDELASRIEAMKNLGIEMKYGHSLLQYLSPTHPIFIACYVLYAVCFIVMTALKCCNYKLFENVALTPLYDFRKVSTLSGCKMILAHMLLPLEKFGMFGFILGIPYWICVLPVAFLIVIMYSVPAAYLTVRILIPERLPCISTHLKDKKAKTNDPEKCDQPLLTNDKYISKGTSTIESTFMLDKISKHRGLKADPVNEKFSEYALLGSVTFLLRLVTLGFMLAVLLLMTEFFGFLLEVCVFTLMGTIVNAGMAAKYAMLFFWILIYASSCYNHVYQQYVKMNGAVFDMIKGKLKDEITDVTRKPMYEQENTAFNYFKQPPSEGETKSDKEKMINDKPPFRKNKCLHWTLKDVVMFVDKTDKPRIPLKLFHQISEIKAPGCPGSVFLSQLAATRNFLYMVIFLLFVLIVIMAFGNVYHISSTNQMLATLAGGFIPFVIKSVLKPKGNEVNLNTYSFDGKIYDIIRAFKQTWPIYDFIFQSQGLAEGGSSSPASDTNQEASQQTIDLIVTVEDSTAASMDYSDETISSNHEIVITPRYTFAVIRRENFTEVESNDIELQTMKRA